MAARAWLSLARQGLPKCRGPPGLLALGALARGQSSSAPSRDHTPEHEALRESLRKIIDKEINPFVDKWEEEGQFPAHQVFKILGRAGFLGVSKPTEYGGLGLDFSYSIAVAEELGSINCGGIPLAIGVQSDMATPALARFGSDELKKEFLAPSIAGDVVACLGVSEAGAGSDVASIKTQAVRKGDDYIINGDKMWITSGCQADWMCLLANTSDGPPHKNKSLLCLPMKLPGVHIGKKIEKLGMRSSDTAQIFFEDVRIPSKYLIGEEGMGFMYQMLQFQEERMWGAASSESYRTFGSDAHGLVHNSCNHVPTMGQSGNGVVTLCQKGGRNIPALIPLDNAIQETIDYTQERKTFNKPILHNQVVHFRLAELKTEVELLRSLLYRAVALYVCGHDVTKFASMAKLKAGRLAREVTDSCLQFWGGMGYTNEVLMSRRYRDARLASIGGGADEVMLSIICKYMDILPK